MFVLLAILCVSQDLGKTFGLFASRNEEQRSQLESAVPFR